MLALYVTHPEVVIDPTVPSTEWRLSPEGRARAERFAARALLPKGARIIASTERKTMETAAILSGGQPFESDDMLRENERSATGYVGPETVRRVVQRHVCPAGRKRRWLGDGPRDAAPGGVGGGGGAR